MGRAVVAMCTCDGQYTGLDCSLPPAAKTTGMKTVVEMRLLLEVAPATGTAGGGEGRRTKATVRGRSAAASGGSSGGSRGGASLTSRDTALLSRALRSDFATALKVDMDRLGSVDLDTTDTKGCDASWGKAGAAVGTSYLCTKLTVTVLADPSLEATSTVRAKADLHSISTLLATQLRSTSSALVSMVAAKTGVHLDTHFTPRAMLTSGAAVGLVNAKITISAKPGGHAVKQSFYIKNTGDADLVITGVSLVGQPVSWLKVSWEI
jgi:hypothetical protein